MVIEYPMKSFKATVWAILIYIDRLTIGKNETFCLINITFTTLGK